MILVELHINWLSIQLYFIEGHYNYTNENVQIIQKH